ncbi:hypothetical protein IQ07DRAFT_122212 [Pyrenochaeta sp. DS3sAY3a]|nr:hypothetical protein IQ07DRAFT_122212 [Pyrenochaeta sp. DS3sAY3a]
MVMVMAKELKAHGEWQQALDHNPERFCIFSFLFSGYGMGMAPSFLFPAHGMGIASTQKSNQSTHANPSFPLNRD